MRAAAREFHTRPAPLAAPLSGDKSQTKLRDYKLLRGAFRGFPLHHHEQRACLCFIQIKLNYVCLHFFRANELRRRAPHTIAFICII